MALTSTDSKIDILREAADDAFQILLPVWLDGLALEPDDLWMQADYWKGGNTLDAAINYWVATGKRDENDLVKKSYALYFKKRNFPDDGAWRDDYGWWGNAFAKAYINAKAIGLDQDKELMQNCLTEAKHCYKILSDSADENWIYMTTPGIDRAIGAHYVPWNNGSAREYMSQGENRWFTYDPTPNTVTGCGFLALILALAQIEGTNLYRDQITKTIQWLYYVAFDRLPAVPAPANPATYKANRDNCIINDCYLVRETATPWVHQSWCFDLDRAWSADQGVFLFNLLRVGEYSTDATKSRANFILQNLLKGYELYNWQQGVISHSRSVNSLIVDDVFREFQTKSLSQLDNDGNYSFIKDTNLSNYNNNYCTGPGVFMRYLGNSYPMLKDDDLKKNLLNMISKTVESALKYQDSATKQFRCWDLPFEQSPYWDFYQWDRDHNQERDKNNKLWQLAPQVAGLDLLVAALKMHSAPPI